MGFENDIMISYAWSDNEPPPMTNHEGWVSGFQRGLEYWLKQVMARPPRIWRDKSGMTGNTVFSSELDEVASKTAVLLAVLSEPYLSSEWCQRELENFVQAAESQGGLKLANDYRIFKINKLPVDRGAIPPRLSVITGFDFYEMDPETKVLAPLDPSLGDADRQRFIRRVYDVAVALARLIKQLESSAAAVQPSESTPARDDGAAGQATPASLSAPAAQPAPGGGMTVFLPFVTRDLREVRDDLVAELTRRNCKVLPEEQSNEDDSEAFEKEARAQIASSAISIHLVGSRYGSIMEGETKSVVELQNEWAAEESRKRDFKRLIWIPRTIGEVTGQQQAFLERLRTDREAIAGADLLEDSVENLKSIVLEMAMAKPKVEADPGEGECKLYLMHDESDREAVREIRKALKDATAGGRPVRLLLPLFDGEAAALREVQRQRILECDAVMLFWGASSQVWVDGGLSEVRKSPAYGRSGGFKARHLVYISGTRTSAKEDWLLDDADGLLEEDLATINALEGPNVEALNKYIQTIQ
ncbi:MAG: hypothetical protein RLZZ165_2251 [Bacteroidota bacterium]|jgi:hypothetical protein